MARTYKRDSRGRFAGGGGGSSGGRGGRPATKRVQRGTNRLTRDNSGKITGQGGSGATARGGRLKTASGNQRATQLDRLKGRIAGTVGKGGKVRGGGTNTQLRAARLVGQRKRSAETAEKGAQRRLERVRFRQGQLQEKKAQLESSLNRRRGRLEGDDRRRASKELRKTKISLDRIGGARQQYENTVNRRQSQRGWNLNVRGTKQAPANAKTARNRFDMLRRRVSYLRKDENPRFDKWGSPYAGPKLAKAAKDLSSALAGVSGQRISVRSKAQASAAQKAGIKQVLSAGRTRGSTKNVAETNRSSNPSRIAIGTSRQGDLLTGKFSRTRSGAPRPRRR